MVRKKETSLRKEIEENDAAAVFLNYLVKNKGAVRNDLADVLMVTLTAVHFYIHGHKRLSFDQARKLSQHYKLKSSEFYEACGLSKKAK